MHPKLHLLEFDGGSPHTRFLRVVITSANLGPYEGALNNNFWVHDFPVSSPARGATPPSSFATDLLDFVVAMLRPSPELTAAWTATLSRYDLSPPAGVQLVASVPGRYPSNSASDKRYGAQAVKLGLRAQLAGRHPSQRHALVEFAFSSVGQIDRLNWHP